MTTFLVLVSKDGQFSFVVGQQLQSFFVKGDVQTVEQPNTRNTLPKTDGQNVSVCENSWINLSNGCHTQASYEICILKVTKGLLHYRFFLKL